MDIFNVLTLIGGLCLFLFGMNLMGQALERRAGGKLRSLLDKLTSRRVRGLSDGPGRHRHHPELLRHHGDGGGLCQLRPHDPASGHQRHYGRQCGHHRHRLAAEPGGHRQRQPVDPAAEALLLHPGAGAGGHHLLHVLQGRQEEGHRHHSAGLCHPDVRHGDHERRGVGPEGCARVHRSCS